MSASGAAHPARSFNEDLPMAVTSMPGFDRSAGRLLSIDALRGFTMFWLIGGRELALSLIACLYPPWFDAWETQLTHPKWQGLVAWDLVMPVFLFVTGTSISMAMARRSERCTSLPETFRRIARRVAVLWVLGMVLQAVKPDTQGLELYSNALQAIAAGSLVTSLALLYLPTRGQIGLIVFLVLGYGALLMFMPFPGHPAGMLERRLNLPHFVDELVLGSFRRDHSFAWVLPSLGFSATVLMGAMAGHLLRGPLAAKQRMLWLLAIGSGCMVAGLLWSTWLPLNRYLWTSSMILWAGGIGFWLTALFHGALDAVDRPRLAFPLVVIGVNALLAYVADPLFVWMSKTVVSFCCGEDFAAGPNIPGSLLEIAGLWLLLWVLYRKGVCFRA